MTAIEGSVETIFKEITETRSIPNELDKRLELLTTMLVMYARTEHKVGFDSEMFNSILKECIRLDPKAREPKSGLDQLSLQDPMAALRSVRAALSYPELIYDLELRVLIAPRARWFVTSDHPVVLLNQAFFPIVKSSQIMGIAMKGLQIFLPLCPEVLLFAFDKTVYRVKGRRSYFRLEHDSDIDLVNALQVLNAAENIYFKDENDLPLVRLLKQRFVSWRARVIDSAKPKIIKTPIVRHETIIDAGAPVIPPPGKWSFCKPKIGLTEDDFGPRDPTLCTLTDQHAKYARALKDPLPFSARIQSRQAGE
jgi:hypothetical protein